MKKKILITGSTDGIGKLAAIMLAKEGHKDYLHGRSQDKLTKVIAELKEQSNTMDVNGFVADFSDLAAVRQMAHSIQGELPQLDILINNAGIFKSPNEKNKDGLDIRFVVICCAPYLLTD